MSEPVHELKIEYSINNNGFAKFQAIKKQGTRLALIWWWG